MCWSCCGRGTARLCERVRATALCGERVNNGSLNLSVWGDEESVMEKELGEVVGQTSCSSCGLSGWDTSPPGRIPGCIGEEKRGLVQEEPWLGKGTGDEGCLEVNVDVQTPGV